MINADKPYLWKADVERSVDTYNAWFLEFAPPAFRETRRQTAAEVSETFRLTDDLYVISPETLLARPRMLPALRMSTAPPIARDRLAGLAGAPKGLIYALEKGRYRPHLPQAEMMQHLGQMCRVLLRLLDRDIFPWLEKEERPSAEARERAAAIVADRLCGTTTDPIIRNAQKQRQLSKIEEFLTRRGYKREAPDGDDPRTMDPGTFTFHLNVRARQGAKLVNVPVDVAIQPKQPRIDRMPILVEAKSAGDFTNVNKRRKEEAQKIRQLRETYGEGIQMILFLCGYFDAGYLGYEAAEGLDWVWEHRMEDMDQLGL